MPKSSLNNMVTSSTDHNIKSDDTLVSSRRQFILRLAAVAGGSALTACGGGGTIKTDATRSPESTGNTPPGASIQPGITASPDRGPTTLPAWVPPAGYFADVPMVNNPVDVTPSIYTSGDMQTAFSHWGGSAILRDYSALGAQVYHSAGHESASGLPNIQLSLICDFSTLTWSTANIPVAANISSIFTTIAGLAPDGTPYNPHTYLGLQEMPRAWGGGSKGTLAQFLYAGSGTANKINLLDVSARTHGYTQLSTIQPQNADPSALRFSAKGSGGNYPISVMDRTREGWWLAVNGTVDYTLFINRSGMITQYPALGGNCQNASMVLCDSLNLLIMLDGGYSSGSYTSNSYRSMYIRDLSTNAITTNSTLGTVPSLSFGYDGSTTPNFHRPDKCGFQWVEELGYIVGLDESTTPPSIVKLTPPSVNPATSPWTWSTVPVQHWTAGDAGGYSTLRSAQNGAWSKFRYVETLKAFVYGASSTTKPQVVKVA